MANRRAFLQTSAALASLISLPLAAKAAPATRPAALTPEGDALRAVTVAPPAGPIRGLQRDGIRVFRGIPYAMPPVGERRFKVPQPMPAWHDTFDAFTFGDAPLQAPRVIPATGMALIGKAGIGEDSLTLNIWAPAEPGPHPVFVWVYGGSNIAGAGSQAIYDGSHFAREGVVCVTLNYRVGAMGFLELGDVLGPAYRGSGNNGNRDQVRALQWVHDNIAAFGGDPARVTLAGESAGAKNVAAVLAMPSAQGLYQSAILQSGGGQTVHDLPQADAIAKIFVGKLAELGVSADSLPTASAQTLLEAQVRTIAAYPHAFAFRPIVDGETIPMRPQEAIARGAARNVRMLIGSNRDESVFFFPRDLIEKGRANPTVDVPITDKELAQLDVARMRVAATRYQQAFPDMPAFTRRVRMLTAEEYWVPTVRFADAHAGAGGETWMYRFETPIAAGPYAGFVPHASDLPYVWGNVDDPFMQMFYKADVPIPPVGRAMHAAWVAFVKGGAPAAEGLPTWPRYHAGEDMRPTMIFDAWPHVATNPAGKELVLWDGLL